MPSRGSGDRRPNPPARRSPRPSTSSARNGCGGSSAGTRPPTSTSPSRRRPGGPRSRRSSSGSPGSATGCVAVAPCAPLHRPRRLLLDRPAVPVRVAEEEERVPRATVAVLPLAVLEEPDRCRLDALPDELGAGGLDVRDAELQTLEGAGRQAREPRPDRDRAGRAGRRQLDDPEVVTEGPVDVEMEATLLLVERLRPVDVGHRDDDQLEREIHRFPPGCPA